MAAASSLPAPLPSGIAHCAADLALADLAALSMAAYDSGLEPGSTVAQCPLWTCLEAHERKSFRAVVFCHRDLAAAQQATDRAKAKRSNLRRKSTQNENLAARAVGDWARPGDTVVIAFRGSVSLENWAFNLLHIGHRLLNIFLSDAVGMEKSVADEFTDGALADTFQGSLDMFHEVVRSVVARSASVSAGGEEAAPRIMIVGHSLGGFLTQLMCATYNLPGVTFNAPPLGSYEPKGKFQVANFKARLTANAAAVENHRMNWDVLSQSADSGSKGLQSHHGRLLSHSHRMNRELNILMGLSGIQKLLHRIHSIETMHAHLRANGTCPTRDFESGAVLCACAEAESAPGSRRTSSTRSSRR